MHPPQETGSFPVPGFPGLGKGFGVGLAGLVVVSDRKSVV